MEVIDIVCMEIDEALSDPFCHEWCSARDEDRAMLAAYLVGRIKRAMERQPGGACAPSDHTQRGKQHDRSRTTAVGDNRAAGGLTSLRLWGRSAGR